ncbi:MAG: nitrilase-related carbon-nitrogen hydrolase [Bacteroidota bacterium]
MKLRPYLLPALLLLTGTLAQTLAGLNWHLAIPAWIAPLLLLRYSRTVKWSGMLPLLLLLIVAGAVSQTGNKLFSLPGINLANGLTFGLLTLVFYLPDKLLYGGGQRFYKTLIFPSTVAITEYLVSQRFGTWGIIAHTQYAFKPLLQLAWLTGPHGISFLVAWFASVANWAWEHREERKKVIKASVIYGSILVAVILYGSLRLLQHRPQEQPVPAAMVSGVTDLHGLVEREMENFKALSANGSLELPRRIFSGRDKLDTMLLRTEKALNGGSRIIVWSESALILNREGKDSLLRELGLLAQNYNAWLLPAFLAQSDSGPKPFDNLAVLLGPDGKTVFTYKKSFLHPYAEAPVMNAGNFVLPFADTEYGRIAVAICADLDLPGYMKQLRENQVDLLLAPSYDWPGIDPLHAHMAVLTVITNGSGLMRANGRGIELSCDRIGITKHIP